MCVPMHVHSQRETNQYSQFHLHFLLIDLCVLVQFIESYSIVQHIDRYNPAQFSMWCITVSYQLVYCMLYASIDLLFETALIFALYKAV